MALLSGIVGAIGLHGTRQLGLAVEQTSAAASALTQVSDAAGAVGAFIGRHDPAVMDRGLTSIDGASASVADAVLAADQREEVNGELGKLKGAMERLSDGYTTLADARETLTRSAATLSARAAELEKASAAEMDRRETESLNVALFLTTLRDLSTETSAFRSNLLEARLALSAGGRGADAAAEALGRALEAVAIVEGKSGATGTQALVSGLTEKLGALSRMKIGAGTDEATLAIAAAVLADADQRRAISPPPTSTVSKPRRPTSRRAIRPAPRPRSPPAWRATSATS